MTIKIYKEKLRDGRLLEIPYDTQNIKDVCSWCKEKLHDVNREKRYEIRGNCCAQCQASFKPKNNKKNETL